MYREVAYFVIIVQCIHWVDSTVPRDVRVNRIGPGDVRVEWAPPQDHNAVTGYQILYTEDVNLPDRKWRKVVAQEEGLLVLEGLTEGKYFFKIKAVLDGTVIGQASDVQELNMQELNMQELDALVPRYVQISLIGPGYVRIEWAPPQDHNAVTGYQILCTEDVNLPDRKWRKVVAQDEMLLLKGLTEGMYFFKVKAVFDGSIIGQASDVQKLNVIERDGTEMLPKITKVEQGTRPSIAYVYWTQPDYLDGRLLKYELYYGQTPLSKSAAKLTVDQLNYENFDEVDRYMVKVMNLLYDTEYDFMIKVVTKDNVKGVDSKIYKFRTMSKKIPEPIPKPKPKPIPKPTPKPRYYDPYETTPTEVWMKVFVLLLPVWFWVFSRWIMPLITIPNFDSIPIFRTSHQKATKFYEEKKYREALDAYKDIIRFEKQFDRVEIYFRMAVCFKALKQLEECIKYCNEALSYDPKKVEALVVKGKALTRLRRFHQAFSAYQAAFRADPSEENRRFVREAYNRLNPKKEKEEQKYNQKQPTTWTEHFRILGLAEGATNAQIKEAYKRETRKFHPDKHSDATPEEVLSLNRRTQRIREAYQALYTNPI